MKMQTNSTETYSLQINNTCLTCLLNCVIHFVLFDGKQNELETRQTIERNWWENDIS